MECETFPGLVNNISHSQSNTDRVIYVRCVTTTNVILLFTSLTYLQTFYTENTAITQDLMIGRFLFIWSNDPDFIAGCEVYDLFDGGLFCPSQLRINIVIYINLTSFSAQLGTWDAY